MSLIKNYGLYWERSKVNWGMKGPGNKGSLDGYAEGTTVSIDFREQVGIYVLYDGADIPSLKVTYIGQVGRPNDSLYARLKEHTTDHLWNRWTRFSWFGAFNVGKANTLVHAKLAKGVHSPLPEVLDHIEGVLITLLEPPLNKRGANWGGASQYFQVGAGTEINLANEIATLQAKVDALTAAIKKK